MYMVFVVHPMPTLSPLLALDTGGLSIHTYLPQFTAMIFRSFTNIIPPPRK